MTQWSMEQLRHLHDLEASPNAQTKIAIIPQSRGSLGQGYGSNVLWEARLYRQGIMGPLPVNEQTLQSSGLSQEDARYWASETQKAVSTLNKLYPELGPGVQQKLNEIEQSISGTLPAGEQ